MCRRPVIVVVVAVFLGVATVIAAAVGMSLGFPGTVLDRMWALNRAAQVGFHPLGRVAGALMAAVGVATAAACGGLLRGRRWAWLVAIAIFATNGLGDFVDLLIARDWVKSGSGALIAAIFLFLLLRPDVRAYFATRHSPDEQLSGAARP